MRAVMSSGFVVLVLSTIGGCQSWSQINPAIPTGARVPPPGTGTYPVSSQYYNAPKTGAVPAATNGQSASATAPVSGQSTTGQSIAGQGTNGQVMTAAWQPPSVDQLQRDINNTAGAALQNATNRANQVVQASTARAAEAAQRYTAPLAQGASNTAGNYATTSISASGLPTTGASANGPSNGLSASRSLSDSGEGAQLDWQPPR